MKTFYQLLFGALLFYSSQGCISPVNMAYDSAAPLKEKQLSITAAYGFSEEGVQEEAAFDLVNNYMARLGFGLSEKTSLYLGYYHKDERLGDSPLFDPTDYAFAAYDFFECGGKFSLSNDQSFAIKVLAGGYIVNQELVAYSLYGSMIYTHRPKLDGNFELSVIAHGTGIYERNGLQVLPGLNIGAGISSDINKWAIRPEVGFNLRAFTAGIGLEFKLGKSQSAVPEN